jgi:hypothetical protein
MLVQLLREALERRCVFTFDYDDKPRVVEPHALGLNKKGEMVVRGFQTNCEPPAWKMFVLEKAQTISIHDDMDSQAPRPGYKAGDKAMVEILAQLPEPQPEAVAA